MAKNKQHKVTKRKTVGQAAVELQQKAPEILSPLEIQRKHEKEYIDNLIKCVQQARPKYEGDFFVVVITKNEKLLYNVIRCLFLDRNTCPTPDYDQSVFHYKSLTEELVHIWTVPDKESCLVYLHNKHQIDPSEHGTLDFILRFKSGDLFKLCKKFNNEEEDSPLLIQ